MWNVRHLRFQPVIIATCFTFVCLGALITCVDLKPKVDEYFFFSSDDPHFQDDKKIAKMFPQLPQIILAAKGDLHAPTYSEDIEKLSSVIEKFPIVLAVQSLTRGPTGLDDALEGPLWKRTLISRDNKSSLIFAFLKDNPDSEFIETLQGISEGFNKPGFELMISGVPYIVELIRQYLFRDLKIFSLVAFVIFSIALLIIFHSLWIVAGVLIACFNSAAFTLLIARFLGIEMGFLTANLPTIVFVLTLSHIAFLTADWKQRITEAGDYRPGLAWEAARSTFHPALWSTVTALLGFLTLLFVQAKSLRQLGILGSLGTFISLAAAYGLYPWFLELQKRKLEFLKTGQTKKNWASTFFAQKHRNILIFSGILSIFCLVVLPKLSADPSLFDYFKKGSVIRNGLEYIDANGGSNPLNIVIEDPEHEKLNSKDAYQKMWSLHLALEQDPAVGNVISLPIVVAEVKSSLLTKFMTTEWLLDVLDSPRFGEIAKYFVTENRRHALFMLRMKEAERSGSRLQVVERIKEIVRKQGYQPFLVGGVFNLQGRLSQLITSSLISGSGFLNAVILMMTWFLSRSWKYSLAMLASLYFVPITMLGILSFIKMPLDVIAAPAVNVAIGMGVDSMIHLIIRAKRLEQKPNDWEAWAKACAHLWDPILWSSLMVVAGFSIFMLSNFPPTQRFGFSVVLGTVLAPLATLFILPWLATFSFAKKTAKE